MLSDRILAGYGFRTCCAPTRRSPAPGRAVISLELIDPRYHLDVALTVLDDRRDPSLYPAAFSVRAGVGWHAAPGCRDRTGQAHAFGWASVTAYTCSCRPVPRP